MHCGPADSNPSNKLKNYIFKPNIFYDYNNDIMHKYVFTLAHSAQAQFGDCSIRILNILIYLLASSLINIFECGQVA